MCAWKETIHFRQLGQEHRSNVLSKPFLFAVFGQVCHPVLLIPCKGYTFMQHVLSSSTDQWSDEFTLYALTDPAVIANPYKWYECLRRFGPIYLDETVGWVCTGFPECERILRNEKQFQVIPPVPPRADADLTVHFGQQMLFLDANGAEHRHIRYLLAQRLLSKKSNVASNDHWHDCLTQAAKDLLMEKGFDAVFGARPMRRAIQNLIEDPLAEGLLHGRFQPGDIVLVDRVGDDLTLETKAGVTAQEEEKVAAESPA